MSLIEVKNIIKEYETAHALRGVSMGVEKGQWLNIMGSSGSGTTAAPAALAAWIQPRPETY